MNEQISLFDSVDRYESDLKRTMEPLLWHVLDDNGEDRQGIQFKTNKSYVSVTYRKNIIVSYHLREKRSWIRFPFRYRNYLPDLSKFKVTMKDSFIKINLPSPEESHFFCDAIILALDDAIDSRQRDYSCCSRYQECSNEGKCVNPYPEISDQCRYRINLKHGRNFFKHEAAESDTEKRELN